MNDEVKDMLSKALRDEPPVGVDYDAVRAAGRRRRARRQAGIVGGAALGVAAVVSAAMLVRQPPPPSPATGPASPTTGVPAPAPAGCAMPAYTGGFTDSPDGVASAEELAESARLTEAVGRFALPLPAGVTMEPAKPQLCAIKDSWGTQFTLRSPAGDRTVFLEVKPGARAGSCPVPDKQTACSVDKLRDGGTVRLTQTPAGPAGVLSAIDAWRVDNTHVRVLETGSAAPQPIPRILDNEALITIASAPQLKLAWSGPPRSPEASDQRAAELAASISEDLVLPKGMVAPGLTFRVSQGGYKLSSDVADGAGIGDLFINLNAPDRSATVDCRDQAGCELITMADGRKATVTRSADGPIQRIMLNTLAADGTQVFVMSTNQSVKAQSDGRTARTRPTPPLSAEDLIRVAALPTLRW